MRSLASGSRLLCLLIGTASPALHAQEPEIAPPSREEQLHGLLAIEDPEERAGAIRSAVRGSEVADWIPVIRQFRPSPPQQAGTSRHSIELWNGEELEQTELFVHIPRAIVDEPGRQVPLILYGHGTGGSGASGPRLWSQVAEAVPAIVVAPSESGPNVGYRYSQRETHVTLSALRWALRTLPVDAHQVVMTGVSRGGHQSWDLGARFPDRFAGIAPMIGGPRVNPAEGQNNFRYLENLNALPIRDLQGLQDDARLIRNLEIAFEILEGFGADDAQFLTFADRGHSFDFGAVDWAEWIVGLRRDPLPREVVRLAARPGEGRTAWLEIAKTSRRVEDDVRLRVQASEWEKLDELGQTRYLIDFVTERTARASGRLVKRGVLEIETEQVDRIAVWLSSEMIGEDGRVQVTINGKDRRKKVVTSARVLLEDFCQRLDRRFLPVARLEWKPR